MEIDNIDEIWWIAIDFSTMEIIAIVISTIDGNMVNECQWNIWKYMSYSYFISFPLTIVISITNDREIGGIN